MATRQFDDVLAEYKTNNPGFFNTANIISVTDYDTPVVASGPGAGLKNILPALNEIANAIRDSSELQKGVNIVIPPGDWGIVGPNAATPGSAGRYTDRVVFDTTNAGAYENVKITGYGARVLHATPPGDGATGAFLFEAGGNEENINVEGFILEDLLGTALTTPVFTGGYDGIAIRGNVKRAALIGINFRYHDDSSIKFTDTTVSPVRVNPELENLLVFGCKFDRGNQISTTPGGGSFIKYAYNEFQLRLSAKFASRSQVARSILFVNNIVRNQGAFGVDMQSVSNMRISDNDFENITGDAINWSINPLQSVNGTPGRFNAHGCAFADNTMSFCDGHAVKITGGSSAGFDSAIYGFEVHSNNVSYCEGALEVSDGGFYHGCKWFVENDNFSTQRNGSAIFDWDDCVESQIRIIKPSTGTRELAIASVGSMQGTTAFVDCNRQSLPIAFNKPELEIATISGDGATVTITMKDNNPHYYKVGDTVQIETTANDAALDGDRVITAVPSAGSFQIASTYTGDGGSRKSILRPIRTRVEVSGTLVTVWLSGPHFKGATQPIKMSYCDEAAYNGDYTIQLAEVTAATMNGTVLDVTYDLNIRPQVGDIVRFTGATGGDAGEFNSTDLTVTNVLADNRVEIEMGSAFTLTGTLVSDRPRFISYTAGSAPTVSPARGKPRLEMRLGAEVRPLFGRWPNGTVAKSDTATPDDYLYRVATDYVDPNTTWKGVGLIET